jgi:hypothetical protein
MRFDVMQRNPNRIAEGGQCADLVHHIGPDLVLGEVHLAAAEACEVRESWMRADRHVPRGKGGNSPLHHSRIAAVESAGDVRTGDQREQVVIRTDVPGTVAFPDVAVQIDCHRLA